MNLFNWSAAPPLGSILGTFFSQDGNILINNEQIIDEHVSVGTDEPMHFGFNPEATYSYRSKIGSRTVLTRVANLGGIAADIRHDRVNCRLGGVKRHARFFSQSPRNAVEVSLQSSNFTERLTCCCPSWVASSSPDSTGVGGGFRGG